MPLQFRPANILKLALLLFALSIAPLELAVAIESVAERKPYDFSRLAEMFVHGIGISLMEVAAVALIFELVIIRGWERALERQKMLELEEGREFHIDEIFMVFKLDKVESKDSSGSSEKILVFEEYLKYNMVAGEGTKITDVFYYDIGRILDRDYNKKVKRVEAILLRDECFQRDLNDFLAGALRECEMADVPLNCQARANALYCRANIGLSRERRAFVKIVRRYLYPGDLADDQNAKKIVFSRAIQHPTDRVKIAVHKDLLHNGENISDLVVVISFDGTLVSNNFEIDRPVEKGDYYVVSLKPVNRPRFYIMEGVNIFLRGLSEG